MSDNKDANSNLACVESLMLRCQQTELYGVVHLVMKRGVIQHVEVTQSMKPDDIVAGRTSPIKLVPGSTDDASQKDGLTKTG